MNPRVVSVVAHDGFDIIEWPHQQDVCPDTLYEESVPVDYGRDSHGVENSQEQRLLNISDENCK